MHKIDKATCNLMTDFGVTDRLQQRLPPLAAKNHKEKARLCLKNIQRERREKKNCNQNQAYRFQIINLSFTHRNSATFHPKVACFWSPNRPFDFHVLASGLLRRCREASAGMYHSLPHGERDAAHHKRWQKDVPPKFPWKEPDGTENINLALKRN